MFVCLSLLVLQPKLLVDFNETLHKLSQGNVPVYFYSDFEYSQFDIVMAAILLFPYAAIIKIL